MLFDCSPVQRFDVLARKDKDVSEVRPPGLSEVHDRNGLVVFVERETW
jgi:hypothetical protein